MKKRLFGLLLALMMAAMLVACGSSDAEEATEAPAEEETEAVEDGEEEEEETEAAGDGEEAEAGEMVVLTCVADATPHSEILEAAKDLLAEEGIEVDIVSQEWSETWNSMLVDGEVDFAYFMHVPAMESIEEEMGVTLYSMGGIHIEPYACFSNKYESVEDLPDDASICVPNDASNEYRALKVLEDNGFITLSEDMNAATASIADVTDYIKPITITEMDQNYIIPSGDDFDAYFVNVNRALEAGLDTSAYLMREGEDSEYANIITVTEENKDNEAIKKMVEVLKSDEIKQFIVDSYDGAVIPAE